MLRIGFTASKKVGNAVIRNRAKRRLRAAASASCCPFWDGCGHDYVLVARGACAVSRPFAALVERYHHGLESGTSSRLDTNAGDRHLEGGHA